MRNRVVKLPFTAALLAGGKSRRMGRDKALLRVEWEGNSVPLWDRQLSILKAVAPAELVISGPQKQGYPASVRVLADEWDDAGPLAGITTSLSRSHYSLLLVLAIDLPRVQPGFLQKLLTRCETDRGVVPVLNNRFEPLVAVYPKAAHELARTQLQEGDYVVQHFVDKLIQNRLVACFEVERDEQEQLENWNTPEDLRGPHDPSLHRSQISKDL
jgi:molybdopterin-guanine dinucleotide biosynthesis protein A